MMTCLDCKKELSYMVHRSAMEQYGVELCEHHQHLIKRLIRRHNTPVEAVQLYYGLKRSGVYPMLEWWDGTKSIDIALSRVKLNLEVDMDYQMLTCEQAINTLEARMHSYKDGFTTIRIPHVLIRQCLADTIDAVLSIMESMKAQRRVV